MITQDQCKVIISPEIYKIKAELQEKEIKELKAELERERGLRESLSQQAPVTTRKRRNTPKDQEYSDFKSDGKRKPHAADSIRSYDDFVQIQKYYLSNHRVRDWTMWTVGVSLGLRVSDLLSLKFKNILNADGSFRPRLKVYEKKTGKINDCLITESVQKAIAFYLKYKNNVYDMDEYVFSSGKTKGKMYEEGGWRILSEAGKNLGLPLNIGSHTMRKSFANIAACVDKSCVDMNTITKVQGLLNHSDQKVTMRYLGAFRDMYDRARIAVSDFVLGKTEVTDIIAGSQCSMDDLMEKIELIADLIQYKRKEH